MNSLNDIFSGTEYYEESIDITRTLIDIQRELYNNFLIAVTCRDYILQLCEMNRTAEARAFLKGTGEKILGLADVGNFISICTAIILFAEKKHHEALELISRCSAEMHLSAIDIRFLKVKLAFRLRNTQLFEAGVNNLRKNMSTEGKKHIRERIRNNVLSQLRYAVQLFKIPASGKKQLLQLRSELLRDDSCYHKLWLLGEINEKLEAAAEVRSFRPRAKAVLA
jgi:hypothetical protein